MDNQQNSYGTLTPAPHTEAGSGDLPRLQLPENPFARRLSTLQPAARQPAQAAVASPDRPATQPRRSAAPATTAAAPTPSPAMSVVDLLPPPTGMPVGHTPATQPDPSAYAQSSATTPAEHSPHRQPAPAAETAHPQQAWPVERPAEQLGGVFAMGGPVAHAASTPAAWSGQFTDQHTAAAEQVPALNAWQHDGAQAPAMRLGPPAPLDAVPANRPAPTLASIRQLTGGGRAHTATVVLAAMSGGFALVLAKVTALAPITGQALTTALVLSTIALVWAGLRLRSVRDDARIVPGGAAWAVRGLIAVVPATAASARFGLLGPIGESGAGAVGEVVGSVASSMAFVAIPLAVGTAVAMLIRNRLSAAHQPQLVAGACAAMLICGSATASMLVSLLLARA